MNLLLRTWVIRPSMPSVKHAGLSFKGSDTLTDCINERSEQCFVTLHMPHSLEMHFVINSSLIYSCHFSIINTCLCVLMP